MTTKSQVEKARPQIEKIGWRPNEFTQAVGIGRNFVLVFKSNMLGKCCPNDVTPL
jgi:hypothetical protein